MTAPAPGWYPDPASDANIRYWDGQAWTDEVQPKDVAPPSAHPWGEAPEPSRGDVPEAGFTYFPVAAGMGPAAPAGGYQAPPLANPAAGPIGPDGQVLSGWWRRAGGLILDSIIIAIPTAIVTLILIYAMGGPETLVNEDELQKLVDDLEAGNAVDFSQMFSWIEGSFWTLVVASTVVSLILGFINGVILVARSGQTLGDRVVHVRKVQAGRTVPSFGAALLRWVIPTALNWLGTIGSLLLMLDYLWAAWDPQKQTLHDKAARTYVERADLSGPPNPRR